MIMIKVEVSLNLVTLYSSNNFSTNGAVFVVFRETVVDSLDTYQSILLLLASIFLSGNCFSDLQYYTHDFAQRFIILLEDEVKAIYIASYV